MDDKKSFEIYLIKKIPFLTKFLGCTLVVLAIIIILITMPFLPSKLTNEVRVLYFMTLVPDFLKTLLFYASCLFVLVIPFYFSLRLNVKGVLVFGEQSLEFICKRASEEIELNTIHKIYIHDPQNVNGFPKEKLQLYFMLNKQIIKRIRLANYSEAEMFVNKLFKYENIKFEIIHNNSTSVGYD